MLQGCRVRGLLLFALLPTLLAAQGLEKKCPSPPIPSNARVKLSNADLTFRTTATYTCDDGYELFGSNATITCTPGGTWSGELPFCGTNVAFRKPANQSTSVRGGSAANGNDGEKTTEHDGKRCTETQKEASPWWQVDLLRPYPVRVVRVTTRGCCGHQPLQDLEIRVGNSSSDLQRNPLCAWFPGTIDEGITKTFTCARTVVGQHVFLQLVGVEGSLSLCEVEVFTTEEFSNDRCSIGSQSDNTEITVFSRNCYEFNIAKGSSFEEARKHCFKQGGDLVHGFQGATKSFLLQVLETLKPKMKTSLVWVGARKDPGAISRTWRWVNGEIVNKPPWGKEQPNNYNGEQNCVMLDGVHSWLWNDVGCNLDYLHWICQYSPVACGSPDKLLNTVIVGSNHTVGSQIAYKCPIGHMIIGDQNRTCGDDGFWAGSAPSCKFVDCGVIGNIDNGTIVFLENRTTHGAVALYKCKQNYTLIGNAKRQCGDNGKWSGQVPECLFDWCPDPPQVAGAIVKADGHQAGSVASYECHAGFILFGQPSVQCSLGGNWSGTPPACKYIDCGTPAHIDHGTFRLLNDTTTHGSVAQYVCDLDYWISGSDILTCSRDGKWSHDTPSCDLITCEEPEVPQGGYVIGIDLNIHSSINFHCDTGYKLVGESSSQCTNNGVWSGESPTCEYIDCGKITPMLYGQAEYVNETTHLGSIIKYACSDSYRLVGPHMRKCQENRQWSESSPRCEEIRCPEPIIADHSILSVTGNDRMYGRTLIRTVESSNSGATTYKIGALAKYRCERGYKIIGESLSSCEDTGLWSGVTPHCEYVDCGVPGTIQHGKVKLATNATYYGAAVLYECDKNWELDGVSRRLCQDDGTWSSEAPSCVEITCGDPSKLDGQYVGLSVLVSSRSVGGRAVYQCDKGFSMHGNNTRMCSQRGTWTGLEPSCQPVNCKHPGTIENGRVIIANGSTLYGSGIEYHCIPHFQRIGPYLRKCTENGEWSGEEPSCELISNETQDSSNLALSIGIGSGIVLFLLIVLGIIYLRLRKAIPVKNTENIEGAERKEDQNAAVMSYASLHDGSNRMRGHHLYDHVDDNVYDAPYGDHLTDNHTYNQSQSGDSDTTYEPEPQSAYGPNAVVTINGVAVR